MSATATAVRDAEPDGPTHERSREPQPVARARTTEVPAARTGSNSSSGSGSGTSHPDAAGAGKGRGGFAPLPRRVPQTSLAAELREDSAADEGDETGDTLDDFTAERAASSLAGFQRGTLQARDNDADPSYDQEEEAAPEGASVTSTPPADRS